MNEIPHAHAARLGLQKSPASAHSQPKEPSRKRNANPNILEREIRNRDDLKKKKKELDYLDSHCWGEQLVTRWNFRC